MKKRVRQGGSERQAYWEEAMRRWKESGQSVRAFCRNEGVRESAFYFWRRELAQRGHRTEATNGSRPQASPVTTASPSSERASSRHRSVPSFLPVRVVEDVAAEAGRPLAGGGVEMILAHGCTVRVRSGFDRQTLADVLAVLEVRPC
jgi:transposase-like protein